ncbi:MAG: peptide chain release factor N(5)-glutamine methyltransferase [Rhodobacteraceae bacterium]|nr:peptide chain release factor N(5)-glutamine methyltransferase [Paracoccaceae bacterium]
MLAALLREGTARLAAAGVEDAARDSRLLLAFAAGIAADRLTLHLGEPAAHGVAERFEAAVAARAGRRPLAQVTGERLFWGRSFAVTRDTLDPRPETEVLVAAALSAPFGRVLDLGTGTGCILLSLLADRPGTTGLGVDVSTAALEVARANARRHGLQDRAALAVSDWFAEVDGCFDLVVTNPPYIPEAELEGLQPEVRDWEPRGALTPGGDGLGAYRAIAAGAARHLQPGGRLLAEIGPTQAGAVAALFRAGGLDVTAVLPDLDGRDRVVVARRP